MLGIAGWRSAPGAPPEDLAPALSAPGHELWRDAGFAISAPSASIAVAEDLVVAIDGRVGDPEGLRAFLLRRGHALEAPGDAELVLRGWRELGSAILDRLDGQVGMVVVERGSGVLHLVRDGMGARELAWAWRAGTFVFGSSEAAVARAVGARRDPGRMVDLLLRGHHPQPRAAFEGVAALEAGAQVSVGLDRRIRRRVLFAPSYVPRRGSGPDKLADRLREVMGPTADGGTRTALLLDGSLAATALARLAPPFVSTLSVVLEGEDDVGAEIARRLGRAHRSVRVRARPAELLERALAAHGAPFARFEALLASGLAELEGPRPELLFLAAGAGVLAGPSTDLRRAVDGLEAGPWGQWIQRAAEALADLSVAQPRARLEALAKRAAAGQTPIDRRIQAASTLFAPELLERLLHPEWAVDVFEASRVSEQAIRQVRSASALASARAHRARSELAGAVLPAWTRGLNALGIRSSFPFLDPRAVEIATGFDDGLRADALVELAGPELGALALGPELRLERWMAGPAYGAWRTALFRRGLALDRLLDAALLGELLLTTHNPARWAQALLVWGLELELSKLYE